MRIIAGRFLMGGIIVCKLLGLILINTKHLLVNYKQMQLQDKYRIYSAIRQGFSFSRMTTNN